MKRLHLHIKTNDLAGSVRFYSAMFGQEPDKNESDYAKWLLDDPRAHISLSTHYGDGDAGDDRAGFDHAGISIDTEEDLNEIADRVARADAEVTPETDTTCCYARSNKYWLRDPQGTIWELFQTFGETEGYGAEPDRALSPTPAKTVKSAAAPAACCDR